MKESCITVGDYWPRANEIARAYRLVLEDDGEGGFLGNSIELPNVFAQGETADKCVSKLRHGLTVAVAQLLELGYAPPRAGQLALSEQLNFRLTTEEKFLLEAAASQRGLKLSDFVRQTVIPR